MSILSGSMDNSLKLWDVGTGNELHHLSGHLDTVTCCAFSPDGRSALSGSEDRTLRLWDVSTGEAKFILNGHSDTVTCCAVSPDGKTVLSGSADRTLRLWDLSSTTCTRTNEDDFGLITCCVFSPDGSTVLVCPGGTQLKLWHMASDTMYELIGHSGHGTVRSCVFSRDGQTVLSATFSEIRLWDVGDVMGALRNRQDPQPSWDFLRCFGKWEWHGPLKYTLNTWCRGFWYSTFEGWSKEAVFSHDGREYRKTVSAEGRHVVYLGDQVVWRDLCIRTIPTFCGCCAWSPDGDTILAADNCERSSGVLKLWGAGTGDNMSTLEQSAFTWQTFTYNGKSGSLHSCCPCSAFSPDGQTVCFGCTDRETLKLWCVLWE